MITALELRTGGPRAARAAPRLPPSPAPLTSLPLPQGRWLLPPRGTRRTRAAGGGRSSPHTPTTAIPLCPCRGGAAPPPPPLPGSRGARPEGGGGREAVPGLPRWSGPGTAERRGRRGEAGTEKSSGLQLFSSGSCRKRGEGGGPAGHAGCSEGGEPERAEIDPEMSCGCLGQGLGRVFPGLGLFRGLRQKAAVACSMPRCCEKRVFSRLLKLCPRFPVLCSASVSFLYVSMLPCQWRVILPLPRVSSGEDGLGVWLWDIFRKTVSPAASAKS